MLEDREIRVDTERRDELDVITRKAGKELNYEMDPYEWKLVKLLNGETRSIKIKEKDIYKYWDLNDVIIEPQKEIKRKTEVK
jgi:hypothetical protein